MKKFVTTFIFLFCLSIGGYSQEISEKEGRKVLEQIRREIKAEEKEKQKAIKEAEKIKEAEERAKMKAMKEAEKIKEAEERAKMKAEKEKEKREKKIMEDIRRDINGSLEEKVFRSENTSEGRIIATKAAFKIGKERITFLKEEEKEIKELEKSLGIEADKKRVFSGEKFDEVYDKFNSNNSEIELLLLENEELREYLTRLDNMERKLK